jgi:heme-degrading monooxygenase HmoA
MFIAMIRFKVIKEECKAFEDVWLTRDSRLAEVKGFVAFHLLRGPEREDHVLYPSHMIWTTQDDFSAWTKSGQFRAAHQQAGERKPLTLGHPDFEGFEVIQIDRRYASASGADPRPAVTVSLRLARL